MRSGIGLLTALAGIVIVIGWTFDIDALKCSAKSNNDETQHGSWNISLWKFLCLSHYQPLSKPVDFLLSLHPLSLS